MKIKAGNYVTVEEYRQHIGYSTKRPIYDRLKRGDFPGAVMFNGQWLIPKKLIWTDNRVTHGKCVNWRRKRKTEE